MSDLDRVQQTLDALPPKCKRAFILVCHDGLSARQAAQVMHIRQWRVQRFVRRAFAECQRAIHE
jgi:RNA polymerase sigma factor (sigma-70 family)